MKRTINLSNTQFRYQLVFFIHMYGWLKFAFGIFCLGKTCCWHLLTGACFDFYNVIQQIKKVSLNVKSLQETYFATGDGSGDRYMQVTKEHR